MLQSPLLSLLRYTAPFLYRHLSARSFKINASRADPILAQTVLHQIMTCPPAKGGRVSMSTSMSSGSIKVRI